MGYKIILHDDGRVTALQYQKYEIRKVPTDERITYEVIGRTQEGDCDTLDIAPDLETAKKCLLQRAGI